MKYATILYCGRLFDIRGEDAVIDSLLETQIGKQGEEIKVEACLMRPEESDLPPALVPIRHGWYCAKFLSDHIVAVFNESDSIEP